MDNGRKNILKEDVVLAESLKNFWCFCCYHLINKWYLVVCLGDYKNKTHGGKKVVGRNWVRRNKIVIVFYFVEEKGVGRLNNIIKLVDKKRNEFLEEDREEAEN